MERKALLRRIREGAYIDVTPPGERCILEQYKKEMGSNLG